MNIDFENCTIVKISAILTPEVCRAVDQLQKSRSNRRNVESPSEKTKLARNVASSIPGGEIAIFVRRLKSAAAEDKTSCLTSNKPSRELNMVPIPNERPAQQTNAQSKGHSLGNGE